MTGNLAPMPDPYREADIRKAHRWQDFSDARCSCGWGRNFIMVATEAEYEQHIRELLGSAS